jgi:hypothetical protein
VTFYDGSNGIDVKPGFTLPVFEFGKEQNGEEENRFDIGEYDGRRFLRDDRRLKRWKKDFTD